jgi:hypothetical protein
LSAHDALYGYLAGQFADADLLDRTDEQAAVDGLTPETKTAYGDVLAEGRAALASPSLDWRRVGDYANRMFDNEGEARAWLTRMMDLLEQALGKV